jgi:hypothetical protein
MFTHTCLYNTMSISRKQRLFSVDTNCHYSFATKHILLTDKQNYKHMCRNEHMQPKIALFMSCYKLVTLLPYLSLASQYIPTYCNTDNQNIASFYGMTQCRYQSCASNFKDPKNVLVPPPNVVTFLPIYNVAHPRRSWSSCIYSTLRKPQTSQWYPTSSYEVTVYFYGTIWIKSELLSFFLKKCVMAAYERGGSKSHISDFDTRWWQTVIFMFRAFQIHSQIQ